MDDATNADLTARLHKGIRSGRIVFGSFLRDTITSFMERHPYWYPMALFTVTADAIATLEHAIDDASDPDANWSNPWITAQYAVAGGTQLLGARTMRWEPSTTAAQLLHQFTPAMWDFFRNVALADLTHHLLILRRPDDRYRVVLPPELQMYLTLIPEAERQGAVEQLGAGHLVGAQDMRMEDLGEADAEGMAVNPLDQPGALHVCVDTRGARNRPATESLLHLTEQSPLPPITFSGTAQGRAYTGAVIVRFEPLSRKDIDQDYFYPVTVGLAFYPTVGRDNTELVWTDPGTWSSREQHALFRALRGYFEECIGIFLTAEQLPADPEIAECFVSRTTDALEHLGCETNVLPQALDPPGIEGVLSGIRSFFDSWRSRKVSGQVVPDELQKIETRFKGNADTFAALLQRHTIDLASILSILVKHRLYWRFGNPWTAFTYRKGLSAEQVSQWSAKVREVREILEASDGFLNGEWSAALATCREAGLSPSDDEDTRIKKLFDLEFRRAGQDPRYGWLRAPELKRSFLQRLVHWLGLRPQNDPCEITDDVMESFVAKAGQEMEPRIKQWVDTEARGHIHEAMDMFEFARVFGLDVDDIGAIPQRIAETIQLLTKAESTLARFRWADAYDADNGRRFFALGNRPHMVVEAACAHELIDCFRRDTGKALRQRTADLIMLTFPESTAGWSGSKRSSRDALRQLLKSNPRAGGM